MAIVGILSRARGMGKPEFTAAVGSGYLSWCRAASQAGFGCTPRIPTPPQLSSNPWPLRAAWPSLPVLTLPPPSPQEGVLHLCKLCVFLSFWCGYDYLCRGRKGSISFCGHLQRAHNRAAISSEAAGQMLLSCNHPSGNAQQTDRRKTNFLLSFYLNTLPIQKAGSFHHRSAFPMYSIPVITGGWRAEVVQRCQHQEFVLRAEHSSWLEWKGTSGTPTMSLEIRGLPAFSWMCCRHNKWKPTRAAPGCFQWHFCPTRFVGTI